MSTALERIGVVTHYYSHLSVATLRLESGTLRVGDVIHIRGHTTDFIQKVESLEVNHAPLTEVGPNEEFGLKVVEFRLLFGSKGNSLRVEPPVFRPLLMIES